MAKVMIADDAALARKILKNILLDAGHNVVCEAADGARAVEAYRRHRPDVVMMDVTMPELDGLDASRKILAEFPDARVVMVTSINSEASIHQAVDAGAAAYVVKPYRPASIVTAINRALFEA
jgi:two-component system chemotaxis response regulator CheY